MFQYSGFDSKIELNTSFDLECNLDFDLDRDLNFNLDSDVNSEQTQKSRTYKKTKEP